MKSVLSLFNMALVFAVFSLASCNDDLFVDRIDEGDISVTIVNDSLPPTGGVSSVRYNIDRFMSPVIDVVYYGDAGEGGISGLGNRIFYGSVENGVHLTGFLEMDAFYDIKTGELVIDVRHNMIAYPVKIEITKTYALPGVQEEGVLESVVVIDAAQPAGIEDFVYSDAVTSEVVAQTGKTTYSYINTADTAYIFRLPENLSYQQGVFKVTDSMIFGLFGKNPPSVPAIAVDSLGQLVALPSRVRFQGSSFGLLDAPCSLLEPEQRCYTVPPRSMLQVGIILQPTRYRVPFSAVAVSADSEDLRMPFEGVFQITNFEILAIAARAYDLETGEEVRP